MTGAVLAPGLELHVSMGERRGHRRRAWRFGSSQFHKADLKRYPRHDRNWAGKARVVAIWSRGVAKVDAPEWRWVRSQQGDRDPGCFGGHVISDSEESLPKWGDAQGGYPAGWFV